MSSKSLAGLLVLVVLAAGVYWTRFRTPPIETAGEEGAASAGQAEGGETSMAHRVGMAMSDGAMPDVTSGEASMNVGDVRITLAVDPGPPRAFQENRFRVRVESASGPVALEDGRIRFEMKMPMGDHRYSLVAAADGWQEAVVVLPFCKSGDPRWYAIVEGTVAGEPHAARFRFDLAKQSE